MTNAATGQAIYGKNIGWRKAVRYALTENPISTSQSEQRVGLISKMDKGDSGKKSSKLKQQGLLTQYTM